MPNKLRQRKGCTSYSAASVSLWEYLCTRISFLGLLVKDHLSVGLPACLGLLVFSEEAICRAEVYQKHVLPSSEGHYSQRCFDGALEALAY